MIAHDVYDAVRRGYSEFQLSSVADIEHYFINVSADAAVGHAANIKGILFEQQVVDALLCQGIEAAIFDSTNHPATDVFVDDGWFGDTEFQLKATDSTDYIRRTLEQQDDIPIITTDEVASQFQTDMVINSGISNEALDQIVYETLFSEQEFAVATASTLLAEQGVKEGASDSFVETIADGINPISPIGLLLGLIGLPFA